MGFNSVLFLIFLSVTFGLYWGLFQGHLKLRNSLLLVASYVFYGWWDWRFLSLIIISSLTDYFLGLAIGKSGSAKTKKWYLLTSLMVNLGILGFFKYFNFFQDNFLNIANQLGWHPGFVTLEVILPVGISFYTFQTLSYTIDVYRGKMTPTRDVLAFCTYVSFFPQLVAGPIERAKHLLPQFKRLHKFNYELAVDGLRQILWGFFKKIVVADNCAYIVNDAFSNYQDRSGAQLCLGLFMFSFQIYADFSGYSDIAIGTSKLFGFRLRKNFNYPYFAKNLSEFWHRWHISLSTWFRDYVYIPLGGSQVSRLRFLVNITLVFVLSGLWHGANWTFLIWGFLHGLLFVIFKLLQPSSKYENHKTTRFQPITDGVQILTTFILVTLLWVFFRSPDITTAIQYLEYGFTSPGRITLGVGQLVFIALMIGLEWLQRKQEHPLVFPKWTPGFMRYGIYLSLLTLIVLRIPTAPYVFLYFQF